MKELNRNWRGENRAASILSFPQGDIPASRKKGKRNIVLGDIAIKDAKRPVSDRLLVHSVLHLLGHKHDTESEYREMRAREDEILLLLKKRGPARP